MVLYMYIALGQEQITPGGQNFDASRKALSFCPFVIGFKKISLNMILYHFFFMVLYMYIAPGQGQITPGGQNLNAST